MSKILNSHRLVSSAHSHKYTIFNNFLILIRYLSISEVSGYVKRRTSARNVDIFPQQKIQWRLWAFQWTFNGSKLPHDCRHFSAEKWEISSILQKKISTLLQVFIVNWWTFFMYSRIRFVVCTWNVIFINGWILNVGFSLIAAKHFDEF